MRLRLAAATALALIPLPLAAQEAASDSADNTFTLGQIVVTAAKPGGIAVTGETMTAAAIEAFNRNHLDDAVNLMPGVSSSNSGGQRNERLIFVRGFDRFQVPIMIDGIRVYLPYDNRLDYGRFLTADVSEIQVAKGYASVLDGPGALGGAINLVTRKPTKEFEAEVRSTLELGRDADYNGYTAFALLGTRQEKWYAQASFARTFRDHWDLPNNFTPTAAEDGGERDFSETEDWRVNAKVGFTPNATDEYSISYTRQEGSKNAPLHVTDPQPQNWNWPHWNLESIYFLSSTAISDAVTLKTRLYRNTFDNLLRGFDNRNQNTQTLAAGRVFNSWYDDEAYGGSVQLDYETGGNRLGIAFHYRRDEHVEYSQVFPTGFIEPPQKSVEDTFSVAVEERIRLRPELSLTAGFAYDWRKLHQSDEFTLNGTRDGGTLFGYPLVDADTWSAQGRIDWTPDADSLLHLSLSSRSRFPTLAERFSSRFGGATSNPDLGSERSTNLEFGASRQFGAVRLEANAFHSWLDNAIVAFPFIFNGTAVSQSRNVGSGKYYGAEAAVSAQATETLSVGANYTWTERDFTDPSESDFEATGVPRHKAFAWVSWQPAERLTVLPSLEVASDRWTVNSAGTNYYRTGSYIQGGLRVDYEAIDGVVLGAGVRNLFDDSYTLTDGFPEPGRSFFLSARARM